MREVFREPVTLAVSEGTVVILGPEGMAAALTPAAAEESALRLLDAAAKARATIDVELIDED